MYPGWLHATSANKSKLKTSFIMNRLKDLGSLLVAALLVNSTFGQEKTVTGGDAPILMVQPG